jgi:hypothetical protein
VEDKKTKKSLHSSKKRSIEKGDMKHFTFLAVVGGRILGNWVSAKNQELEDSGCSSNSISGGE